MKRTSEIAIAAALAGCAAPAPSRPVDPVQAQCEYEAEIAIQSIKNPLYAGYRKAELMEMCMKAKGRGAEPSTAQRGRRLVQEDIPVLGAIVRVDLGEKMMVQKDYEVETLSAGTRISPKNPSADVAVLFDAPSLKAKPIFELRRDTSVEIIVRLGDWLKIRNAGGRLGWVDKNAVTDTPIEVVTSRAGKTLQRVIEYAGRSENRLTISYKEYSETKNGIFVRPAFTQEFMFDLSQGSEIGIKGARMRVIEATNTGIAFEVLKHFAR